MPTDQPQNKKVFLKTYGCQMNVYDSERMSEALSRDGYGATENIADADLVILNTCHIRERAAEKVYSELGRIRDLKAERASLGKSTTVTIAG
ncbi:MAG TPA: tRNA (N6-isopentenyl adenosine(37)-C2)-methylthiotransferase MiaB, partial [Hyphomicrobiaceae bacterium]|nr:tRNA (N6-isopentenyl adenosine(37)-C2)-methylthiotransferase MiaB [Hyphomicrobiaceae bacterium]